VPNIISSTPWTRGKRVKSRRICHGLASIRSVKTGRDMEAQESKWRCQKASRGGEGGDVRKDGESRGKKGRHDQRTGFNRKIKFGQPMRFNALD
jgi:hypothetical protein